MPAEKHMTGSGVERAEVFSLICDQLAEVLGVDETRIRNSEDLRRDVHVDDLVLIELAETLEEQLGKRAPDFLIDDDDIVRLRTIAGLVDYVLMQLRAAEES